MKKLLLIVLFVVILTFLWQFTVTKETLVQRPATFAETKTLSEKTGKPILIIFHASWCVPCRKFETTTLKDPKVQERLSNYIVYTSDIDNEPTLIAEHMGGQEIPAFVIVGKKKTSGYKSVTEFLNFLD